MSLYPAGAALALCPLGGPQPSLDLSSQAAPLSNGSARPLASLGQGQAAAEPGREPGTNLKATGGTGRQVSLGKLISPPITSRLSLTATL